MHVTLTRYFRSAVQCRGYLRVMDDGEERFSCCTLELPWKDNENRISCIPPGPAGDSGITYPLRHRSAEESGTFDYDHFLVQEVEGRSYILIHAGNLYTQILGCILVGKAFVDLNGDGHPDVTNSRDTLAHLRSIIGKEEVPFMVRWARQIGHDGPVPIASPEMEPDPLALPDLSQLPETPSFS